MKKVVTISVILLFLQLDTYGQLTSLGGSLGYGYQYSENLSASQLLIWRSRDPSFSLELAGVLLTPELAEFELQTYYTRSSLSSHGPSLSAEFETENWNIYRFNLSLFQSSPFWILYRARDGFERTRSAYGSDTNAVIGRTRTADQEISLAIRRISFLPPVTLGYTRTHQFAVEGFDMNTRTETYSASAATSNGSTTFNVTGQTSKVEDLLRGTSDKFSAINIDGSKSFSEAHVLDFQAEYSWYSTLGLLREGLSYLGTLNERTVLASHVNYSQSSSAVSTVSIISGDVSVSRMLDNNWRYSLALADFYSWRRITDLPPNPGDKLNTLRSTASVSHSEFANFGTISSSLTFGGNWSWNGERGQFYNLGLSNGYSKNFNKTQVQLSQFTNLSLSRRNSVEQTRLASGLTLGVNSSLSSRFGNQATANYTSNRSTGDLERAFSSHWITVGDAVTGSLQALVPLSVGAGISANWYHGEINGRTYGWNITASSPSFFLDRLWMRYRYGRNFDVLYRIEVIDQSLQFRFNWRKLDMTLTFHERRMSSRSRDFGFSVARPF